VQKAMAQKALENGGIEPNQIKAIGITNQRETVVVWDKVTGQPVSPAIVWQDKRTSEYCEQLKSEGHLASFRERTGLVIDSYFSGTKVKWILENIPNAKERAENGELLMGTIDTWLIWNMTKGGLHITDVTNASRTLLFNIHTLAWDAELLGLLGVPPVMLPEVHPSSAVYGKTDTSFLGVSIPISGIAGDQQAALFGQLCTTPGMIKNTYGTGCFMLMNIGNKPIVSQHNLLTSVGWQIDKETTYVLEGSIFVAGAAIQWLRDSLKIIATSSEVETLAATVSSSEGVYFIPAFAGLGAPHWNQRAKGSIFGLTRGSTDAHLARAALESIAYQTMDVLKSMEADSGIPIRELRVDGGATVNDLLMQFQADVLNTETVRPVNVETTVMGAAFLAGLAVGYWENIDALKDLWQTDVRFSPTTERVDIETGIRGWYRAIRALEAWSADTDD
jgi:glycerol kinase